MTPVATAMERRRARLSLVSTLGAALAGGGLGVLLAVPLAAIAWPAVVIGLAVHVVGMWATQRVLSSKGYQPSRGETAGYWLCWVLIVGLLGYAGLGLLR
jgi:hypothetical protein